MTQLLDTVIAEVKAVSLKGNPWRLYTVKHLPLQNGTYGDTGFYSGQSSYFNMKVLTFANDENLCDFFYTTANLSYDQNMLTRQ